MTNQDPKKVLCTPSNPSGWHGLHKQLAVPGELVFYGQGACSHGPYTFEDVPAEAWDMNDVVASGEWVPVVEAEDMIQVETLRT